MTKKQEFRRELSELLKKYNCDISFSFDGDTQGITDEKVTIQTSIGEVLFQCFDTYVSVDNLQPWFRVIYLRPGGKQCHHDTQAKDEDEAREKSHRIGSGKWEIVSVTEMIDGIES